MAEKVVIGNAEQRVWIYALCDPLTNAPRYVGKTTRPLVERIRQHKLLARRQRRLPVQRWINAVDGVKLCGAYMRVLDVAQADNWAERERHWIAYGRATGWELFNLTDGGEGLHGLVQSAEHRAKNSEAQKRGAMLSCLCSALFWRKPSAIAAGNARFCSRACYQSWQRGQPKAIPKGGVPWNKGRPWTAEERQKISEGKRRGL